MIRKVRKFTYDVIAGYYKRIDRQLVFNLNLNLSLNGNWERCISDYVVWKYYTQTCFNHQSGHIKIAQELKFDRNQKFSFKGKLRFYHLHRTKSTFTTTIEATGNKDVGWLITFKKQYFPFKCRFGQSCV